MSPLRPPAAAPCAARFTCGLLCTCLALTVLSWPLESAARRARHKTQLALEAAEQDFAEGHFRRVIQRLTPIPAEDPLGSRARFLMAYSHFKLGELDHAAELLDSLLAQEFSAERALLRGMVAEKMGHQREAKDHLTRVKATGQAPWSATAEKLLVGIQQREQQELALQFTIAVNQAKKHLSGRRHAQAEEALERAENLMPGRFLTRYYRGYLAYQQGKFQRAADLLRSALSIQPRDGMSRYMLALSLANLDDRAGAQALLMPLSTDKSADPEVRDLARRALSILVHPETARQEGFAVRLGLNTEFDSNPAYLNEVTMEDGELALFLAGALSYELWIGSSVQAIAGLKAFQRFYPGSSADGQTDLSGWVSLSVIRQSFFLGAVYNYTLFLYNHELFSSRHGADLEGWIQLFGSRLSLGLSGWSRWEEILDHRYRYLEGIMAGGSLALKWRLGRLLLRGGYGLARNWADPILETAETTIDCTVRPRPAICTGPELVGQDTITLLDHSTTTDYSFLEHGPQLGARIWLPWRLTLLAGAEVRWRGFDQAGQRVDDQGTVTLFGPRQDTQLLFQVELTRALPAGFEAGIRFESLDNLSSLEVDELGRNLTYSRRIAGLVLRWAWPAGLPDQV